MASYNSTLVKIQKLANQSAKSIQEMVNKSNKQQMTFNSAEAQKSRDWQEKMSTTSHQMEVKDLKKAGLNPVLSAGGNGAQSYTTSSASTQNDSGASASAGIMSEQLGAMTNLESARMTSQAQMKASAQQAAAMRYSAMQSAAAQRYSAELNFSLGKYRADKQQENVKMQTEGAIKIAKINKGSTIPGAIEKALKKAGIYDSALHGIRSKFVEPSKKLLSQITQDPTKFFKDTGAKVTKDNFRLNAVGQKRFDAMVGRLGFKQTVKNRRLLVRAVVFGEQNAFNIIARNYASVHYQHGNKSGVSRRGHR